MAQLITIFNGQTTNATSSTFVVNFPSGRGVFKATGTFGGGTITVQNLAPITGVWLDILNETGNAVTFMANGQQTANSIVNGESVRAVLSGSTGANVTLTLEPCNVF